ncbi:beta-glucosidase [Azospirillum soli]|uniref:beta-glucosidase n=1 Tax=Azospirillum soli TaxID=1304799 RepID=UPI001FE4F6BB|nr:beta-glucosidase [Azospirillum soli]MBP2314363.1 beta-glucosidase/6-phospho-beta-glucosidase/beta-galactosidase [Azospirillum soli]
MGGFECSTHRRDDGRRLDLIAATGHDRAVLSDYRHMLGHGIRTVRDGVRWHLIETAPGRYDWKSLLPMLRAARELGIQPIWDLCHYGWPDDIDIWRPEFVDRFARFAAAVARLVRDETGGTPIYCPVNEIAYWSWAGGDMGMMNPCARGRGFELKHQLVRAAIAGVEAVRAVDPRARFVHVDPVIQVTAHPDRPEDRPEASAYTECQYQSWDMISGALWPGLGGRPEHLDVIGVNYYSDNQWFHSGGTIEPGHPLYRPFRDILADVHARYGRPLLVAETGAEGDARAPWLRYVAGEVAAAIKAGVPVLGICLYPIVDYPGWTNERHCPVGLLGFPDAEGRREVHRPLAEELRRRQAAFDRVLGRRSNAA